MSIDRPSTPGLSLTLPPPSSNPFSQPPGPRSPASPLRFPTSSSAFALPSPGLTSSAAPPAFAAGGGDAPTSASTSGFGGSSSALGQASGSVSGSMSGSSSGPMASPTLAPGSSTTVSVSTARRRLRRPSMLSLAQGPIDSEDEADRSDGTGTESLLAEGQGRAAPSSRLGGVRIAPLSPIIPGKRSSLPVDRDRDRDSDREMKEGSADYALSSGPSCTDTPDRATSMSTDPDTDVGMAGLDGPDPSVASPHRAHRHRAPGSRDSRPNPIWIPTHLYSGSALPPEPPDPSHDRAGQSFTADIGTPDFPFEETMTVPRPPLPTPTNSPPTHESTSIGSGQAQAFSGRPLPASLLATLISERSPAQHEMASEARFQRVLHSHSRALPFTPRQARSTRGRYPEMVEDDDEGPSYGAGAGGRGGWRKHSWTGMASSDSDSDDEMDLGAPSHPLSLGGGARGSASTVEDGELGAAGGTGGVGEVWAGGMDMDRPTSSHSSFSAGTGPGPAPASLTVSSSASPGGSGTFSYGAAGGNAPDSARTTPARGGSGWQGALKGRMNAQLASSPGTGLPGAFGGLGVRTPAGSPTVEKAELGASPGSASGSFGPGTPGSGPFLSHHSSAHSQRPGSSGGPGSASASSWKGALPIGVADSMMAYRESSAGQASSGRTNKRKAHTQSASGSAGLEETRYDPYKRQRATSPSVYSSPGYGRGGGGGAAGYSAYPLSPSRSGPGLSSSLGVSVGGQPGAPSGQGGSAGYPPAFDSSGASGSNSNPTTAPSANAPGTGPGSVPVPASPSSHPLWNHRRAHPYTRPLPMSSRSRAASPALSIGSTSGVLSSSLGKERDGLGLGVGGAGGVGVGVGGRPSVQLGQAFIPTGIPGLGPGGVALEGGQGLGGLGLLSLSSRIVEERSGSEGGDEEGEDGRPAGIGPGAGQEEQESRRGSGETEMSDGGVVGEMDQD